MPQSVIMRARGWTFQIKSGDNVIVPEVSINHIHVEHDPPDEGPRFGDLTLKFYAGELPQEHQLWNYCIDQMPENQPPPTDTHTVRLKPNPETESWNDFGGCRLCAVSFSELDFSQTSLPEIELTWKFRELHTHLTDPTARLRNSEPIPFPRLGRRQPQLQKLDWRTLGF